MTILRVLETCVYVNDLGAAEDFYSRVLGLSVHSRQGGRHVFFQCGSAMLLVFDPEATLQPGETLPHGSRGPGHVAFAVAKASLADWRRRLSAAGVAVEQEIEWPGGGRSLYFRDPAGNVLELATPVMWGLPE